MTDENNDDEDEDDEDNDEVQGKSSDLEGERFQGSSQLSCLQLCDSAQQSLHSLCLHFLTCKTKRLD